MGSIGVKSGVGKGLTPITSRKSQGIRRVGFSPRTIPTYQTNGACKARHSTPHQNDCRMLLKPINYPLHITCHCIK